MKQKYVIACVNRVYSEYDDKTLYFHGFVRGYDITFVFGKKHAQEYDSLEAVNKILVRIKEISGRSDYEVRIK